MGIYGGKRAQYPQCPYIYFDSLECIFSCLGDKKKMKFYNGATIWGKLDKFSRETTATGKVYIEIFLHCQHMQYGNVRILGRIWGQNAVDKFISNISTGKIKKGSDLRLEGNLQQYSGRNEAIKTSFNFYRCEPMPLKEYKAAFRLVGEVVSFGSDAGAKTVGADDFQPLRVRVIQEQKEDFEPKEEIFEVYVPNVVLLEISGSPMPGQAVRLKGYIENPEDEFGDSSGVQRPIVKALEILE